MNGAKKGTGKKVKKQLRPEAKIGLAVIAGGFIMASSVFVMRRNNPAKIADAQVTFEEVTTQSAIDTDNDGLFDWEEAIWRTDPTVADTDNDGTSDGEEIAFGRNPLVAGPLDDLPPSKDPFDPLLGDPDAANQNLTDMTAYVLAKRLETEREIGGAIDKEAVARITNNIPFAMLAVKTPYPVTKEDLILSDNGSGEKLRAYLTDIISAEEEASKGRTEKTELLVIIETIDTDDRYKIQELDPIITGYSEIISNLESVSVPSVIATEHLAYVNKMRTYLQTLKATRKYDTDLMMGFVGMSLHYPRAEAFYAARNKLLQTLAEQGITLS